MLDLKIPYNIACSYRRLDFMRSANFTAPLTYPIGISNDVMAAAPGAAFLEVATRNLRRWNKWMLMKYVQVGTFCGRPLALLAGERQTGRLRWSCTLPMPPMPRVPPSFPRR